jgi:hypothetical protein
MGETLTVPDMMTAAEQVGTVPFATFALGSYNRDQIARVALSVQLAGCDVHARLRCARAGLVYAEEFAVAEHTEVRWLVENDPVSNATASALERDIQVREAAMGKKVDVAFLEAEATEAREHEGMMASIRDTTERFGRRFQGAAIALGAIAGIGAAVLLGAAKPTTIDHDQGPRVSAESGITHELIEDLALAGFGLAPGAVIGAGLYKAEQRHEHKLVRLAAMGVVQWGRHRAAKEATNQAA